MKFGTKMDVASINGIPIFKPGDREKMDGYLGVVSHSVAAPRSQPSCWPSSSSTRAWSGGMHPNVENDKTKFKPYTNGLVLSKMLLLQETNPLDGTPARAALGASDERSRRRRSSTLNYDWKKLNIVGAHGGSVMTTTLPIATRAAQFDPDHRHLVTLPDGRTVIVVAGVLPDARRRDLRAGR